MVLKILILLLNFTKMGFLPLKFSIFKEKSDFPAIFESPKYREQLPLASTRPWRHCVEEVVEHSCL